MARMIERYEEECPNCIYLGPHYEYDLYVCVRGNWISTVISRFGKQNNYESGLSVAYGGTVLGEALERAKSLGFSISNS